MKPEEETNHDAAQDVANPGEYRAEGGASASDRLQWLAFCYVADELTASQRTDFESRLSTDLKAQEALASAVKLSRGIYASYQRPTEPTTDAPLLERGGSRNTSTDRSSSLPRVLLLAAAILVMALIGYGLVNEGTNQNIAVHNSSVSPSSSQFSILADEWIDGLDEIADDELELADSGGLSQLDSDEFDESIPSVAPSEDDDLGVDVSLISFYSEMLDSTQEDGLLNSESLQRSKTGIEL